MARKWVWTAVGLIACAAVIWAFWGELPGQAKQETDPIAAGDKASQRDNPVEQQREELHAAVIGVNAELVEVQPSDDGWTLGVEIAEVPPDVKVMFDKAMQLFRELDRTRIPLQQITILFRTDEFKDVWGNPLKGVAAARLGLAGDVFHQINWHGFEPKNFERLANDWWMHELVAPLNEGGQGGGQQGGGGS